MVIMSCDFCVTLCLHRCSLVGNINGVGGAQTPVDSLLALCESCLIGGVDGIKIKIGMLKSNPPLEYCGRYISNG